MKKIIMAFGATAMLLASTSCAKSSQEAKSGDFNDSLAVFFGRSQGALCAERIQSLPEFEQQKFTKDAFLRGFKQVLMADTSDVAYFYGVSVGMSIAQQLMNMNHEGLEISTEELYRNFAAAFKADTTSVVALSRDQTIFQELMQRAQQMMYEKRTAAANAESESRRAIATENEAKGTAFVDSLKSADPTIKTTESGLSYKVVKEGTGAKATANDNIQVHYVGKLINGETFDSSVDRGEPANFAVSQVVPGFGEGLQLMNKGAKYTFYIPASLAYGNNEVGSIPAGSTLIFDVEVLDITPAN